MKDTHTRTATHTLWQSDCSDEAVTLNVLLPSSISQAVCLESDREKGGGGWTGEAGKGLVIRRGGGNIPLTLLSILGSHCAALGGMEGGPANICDGSTPTD